MLLRTNYISISTKVLNNEKKNRTEIIIVGDFLFSTSYDRTARCWDFDTGVCVRVFRGHKHGVSPILFIPSEHLIGEDEDFEDVQMHATDLVITGSQDTTAKTWSFEMGECLKTFRGHTGGILCLATDSLGKILFTGSSDNTIRAWDIHRGTELHIYDQHQAAVINLLVKSNAASYRINHYFVF